MTTVTEPPRIFATFRYRDPAAMIDWLDKAFGFTVQARHGEGDRVDHAELAYGSAMIMLGAVRDDDYGRLAGAPGPGNGTSLYVATDDVDGLYVRAVAAGARIEEGLTDRDYGSREFICRDPEGLLWCFGTYWPKATDAARP
jgi:uncharacterized glyoxalase superfamily protein PhnB